MTARRAFRFIYGRLVAPLGEDARIEVDALLGDPAAQAEMQSRRREAIAAIGGEIG
jgi:hypothetical protein